MSRLSALAAEQPITPHLSSLIPPENIAAMNRVILAFGEEFPPYCQEEVCGFALLLATNALPGWALENIQNRCIQARSLARLSKTREWMEQSPMAPAYMEFSRWCMGPLRAFDSPASPTEGLFMALVVDRVEDRILPELTEFLEYCRDRALLASRAGVPEEEICLPVSQWHEFRLAHPCRPSFRSSGFYLPHGLASSRFRVQ